MIAARGDEVSSLVRVREGIVKVLWFLLPFAVLLLVWQIIVTAQLVPPVWLPAPVAVLSTFQQEAASGQFYEDIWASMQRLMLGYVVSVGLGVSVGVMLGLHRGIADFFEPLITFLNGLSGIAWIPLAILWFGLGTVTVTFIILNGIFFLIVFNTMFGVRSVPRVYESALMTLGAGRWRVVRDVLVPGALPNIMTGMRMAMGFGWRAVIAAEIFAAPNGLGSRIYVASYYFQTDVVLVGLITIGLIWLTVDRLVLVPVETRTIRRWGTVSRQ